MKRSMVAGLVVATLAFAGSIYAHHAAAGIDRTKTVAVEGTVKLFKWANPHSYIDLEVPNAKGTTDVWSLEMTAPAWLVRAGWKSTTLKAGDKIKATANPFKNGDPGGLFISVTLADGKTLTERAAPAGGGAPVAPPIR
jgi:hypothetical protein